MMLSENAYFITGTDTEIGKTHVSCALLKNWRAQGLRAAGYKPIAAGAEFVDGQWSNEDARRLLTASSPELSISEINPLCLRHPIAPHLAAAAEQQEIEFASLLAGFTQLQQRVDRIIVEGVGGFCVPLNAQQTSIDLARAFNLPVIMVVGMRLGCLNHALLTAMAIERSGLYFAGWIANTLNPAMPYLEENIETLRRSLTAPCLDVIAYTASTVHNT